MAVFYLLTSFCFFPDTLYNGVFISFKIVTILQESSYLKADALYE